MALTCKISKITQNLNNLTEAISLDNWPSYRKTLNNFQKTVNAYLTTLVESDKTGGCSEVIEQEDDDDESEEDEPPPKSPKRTNSANKNNVNKKRKK